MQTLTDQIAALPAPLRHFAAIFLGAMLAYACGAILDANGVTHLDLVVTGRGALDAGFVALATALGGVGVLAATPLTDAYGVTKAPTDDADLYDDLPALTDDAANRTDPSIDGISGTH